MRRKFKTTIIIWSDYNPIAAELELEDIAREATAGDSYCSSYTTERVDEPELDPAWDGTEFFSEEDEDEPVDDDDDEPFDDNKLNAPFEAEDED